MTIDKKEFMRGFAERLEKVAHPDLSRTEFVKGFLAKMAADLKPEVDLTKELIEDKEVLRRMGPGALMGGVAGMLADSPSEAGKMGAFGGAAGNVLLASGTHRGGLGHGGFWSKPGKLGRLALYGAIPGFFSGMLGHSLTKAPRYIQAAQSPRYYG